MTPKVGKSYKLKSNVGNEDAGMHLILGTQAECLAVVKAEPGVHDGGVVLQFPDRNWSCNLPEFSTLFEEV